MARREGDRKERIRHEVWDALASRGAARFPFPPHGRIPNFAGAAEAARRLFECEPWRSARRLKVNPDAPQRHVRLEALRRGAVVFMPTPRLRGGFLRLDPRRIPARRLEEAASLGAGRRLAAEVPLRRLPELDAVVVGSVAVTRRGRRLGKGHGYADLEWGILRELGHPAVPVATTVHELQVRRSLPRDATDLAVALVVTPERAHRVKRPPRAPEGIDWSRLGDEDLRAMPVLRALARERR